MRRPVVLLLSLAALAVPAGAGASPGDGTLVVQGGSAPYSPNSPAGALSVPVVAIHVTGAVLGRIGPGGGKIVIDDSSPNDGLSPEVTGFDYHWISTKGDNIEIWRTVANPMKFRAVGNDLTILVYGADVDLTVVGTGLVKLAGMPDGSSDGTFSLNGKAFRSLPATQTPYLAVGTGSPSSTG
jgi:hypothetical protein